MADFISWLWERDEPLTFVLFAILLLMLAFILVVVLINTPWLVVGLFFVGVATWTWVRWTEYKKEKHRD